MGQEALVARSKRMERGTIESISESASEKMEAFLRKNLPAACAEIKDGWENAKPRPLMAAAAELAGVDLSTKFNRRLIAACISSLAVQQVAAIKTGRGRSTKKVIRRPNTEGARLIHGRLACISFQLASKRSANQVASILESQLPQGKALWWKLGILEDTIQVERVSISGGEVRVGAMRWVSVGKLPDFAGVLAAISTVVEDCGLASPGTVNAVGSVLCASPRSLENS